MFRVKELSELTGLSAQTVRRYDELGIIRPERNEENGYREYKVADLIQLLRIRSLRNYGFGLSESCDVYLSDLSEANDRYKKRTEEVELEIAHLEETRKALLQQMERISLWNRLHENGGQIIHRPECCFFPYRNSDSVVDIENLKEHIHGLGDLMPPFRSCVIRTLDDVLARRVDYSGGLYAFRDEIPAGFDLSSLTVLPACDCLVIASSSIGMMNYRKTEHVQTNNETSVERILRIVHEHDLEVNGTILGEVIHMFKQPSSKSIPHEQNFASYSISWIPVRPVQ